MRSNVEASRCVVKSFQGQGLSKPGVKIRGSLLLVEQTSGPAHQPQQKSRSHWRGWLPKMCPVLSQSVCFSKVSRVKSRALDPAPSTEPLPPCLLLWEGISGCLQSDFNESHDSPSEVRGLPHIFSVHDDATLRKVSLGNQDQGRAME